jgi:hypothetical protein
MGSTGINRIAHPPFCQFAPFGFPQDFGRSIRRFHGLYAPKEFLARMRLLFNVNMMGYGQLAGFSSMVLDI